MGKDAHVDIVRATNQAVQRSSSEPLPPSLLRAVPDEELCDAMFACKSQDGLDGIFAIQDFDVCLGGAGECEIAFESCLVAG